MKQRWVGSSTGGSSSHGVKSALGVKADRILSFSGWQMPPKREATTSVQAPIKVIKMDSDAQDFSCESESDKYRLAEEPSYPLFTNTEVRSWCRLILHELQIEKLDDGLIVILSYFTAGIYWFWWGERFKSRNQNRHHQSPSENRATAGPAQVWTQM